MDGATRDALSRRQPIRTGVRERERRRTWIHLDSHPFHPILSINGQQVSDEGFNWSPELDIQQEVCHQASFVLDMWRLGAYLVTDHFQSLLGVVYAAPKISSRPLFVDVICVYVSACVLGSGFILHSSETECLIINGIQSA